MLIDSRDTDSLWYKDAIIYELHVRAFSDSNADGIGDFRGLTKKLDYLQDLGITAIWLLPFCLSPLRDDGYDISDYTNINPSYGTRRDVHAFVREAHKRGLRVITELVINHTSDQHPWFQRARKAPSGSKWRDWYVWSDSPERYAGTRIIFKDTEHSNWSWDPIAHAYYWHRFFSHQPDLNFENPDVQKALFQVMEFWLDMGVDGLRLDAVPYLFEEEGTSCENLPQTHEFLKKLRKQIDRKYHNRMLLAEANQWPEDAAAYFGEGDECHMNFHFPLMPRLFMAIQMEDRFPIIDILEQTPAIPESCQWGLFLRNHDELTLEMVTDEERDYMYRVFAHDRQARINLGIRRRLSPLLGNDRKKIELMYSLLFSLPGTPVIYYGEELGMGDNFYLGDRNGVRTPMQWSADRNAGFSPANPQKLYLPIIIDPEYHYEAINVEVQQNNAQSLLWWMKRILSLRKQYKGFGRGSIEFLHPTNGKVLVFLRRYEDEIVLVAANLSRYAQCVELDLSEFRGMIPMTIFGKTKFPAIGDLPYFLTLGGHSFYWFSLGQISSEMALTPPEADIHIPTLTTTREWEHLTSGREKAQLEDIFKRYVPTNGWFLGHNRNLQHLSITTTILLPVEDPQAILCVVKCDYAEGEPDTYLLPLGFAPTQQSPSHLHDSPGAIAQVYLKLRTGEQEGVIYDAIWDSNFLNFLMTSIAKNRRYSGSKGDFVTSSIKTFRAQLQSQLPSLEPLHHRGDHSNTSVIYNNQFMLKIFRRVETGRHPELEIGLFLTKKGFTNVPHTAGAIEYQPHGGDPITLGILQTFIPNEGNGWRYTLDALSRYYENALTQLPLLNSTHVPQESLLQICQQDFPELAEDLIGSYLEEARILGQRTGELHRVLGSEREHPEFTPEPFTDFTRRGLYQSMIKLTSQNFLFLKQHVKSLPSDMQDLAKRVLDLEPTIKKRFLPIRDQKISAVRIRCHGNYHLGQVLFTGKDFIIIDFEGDSTKPISIRRLKESPLSDVASMLSSIHYAANTFLTGQIAGIRPEDYDALEIWMRFWETWVSASFLKAYFIETREIFSAPTSREDLQILLECYLLQKMIQKVSTELIHRPDWVRIPLSGILDLMKTEE